MRFLTGLCIMLLSSCAEDGGLGGEGSPIWFSRTTPEQQAVYFQKVCSGYGFSPSTPEMAQCVATEVRSGRARSQAQLQQIGNSLQNTGNSPAIQTTNTRCSTFGNNLNCNSTTF